jgi:glycosyltransferase involved in cell wall biosynthesis
VSRILLVTQQARGFGEFRKPLVRALYRRYVERYRRQVAKRAAALAPGNELTILADRGLVDATHLPAGVDVLFYDEESLEVDGKKIERRNRRLLGGLWPPRAASVPALMHHGVWLPDLLTLVRGIVLKLEVTEPVGIVEQVMAKRLPERVVLVSGASVLERAARLTAEGRGVPVTVAAPWFVAARAYARFWRLLQIRDDKLRIRDVLEFPRREPTPRSDLPRIVFATCRPRHHFVVDPFVETVRAAGVLPHVLAAPVTDPELDARLDGLTRSGVAAEHLSNYLPQREAQALERRHRPVFRRLWQRIAGSDHFARARAEDPVCHALAMPLLRDTVEKSLLVPLLVLEAAWRALEQLRPSALVITSNRRYTERALALAAREKGIPVLMMSGTLLRGLDDYEFLDVANRLLVIGDHLREEIISEQGVTADRISVVGDPRSHAARLIPPAALRMEVARHFDLDADRPIVVFLSKYVSRFFSDREKEAFYRTFIAAAKEENGLQAIVKVHPNEDLTVLKRQLKEWGWRGAVLTKDYDIHRLLGTADAAVMVTSMAGIEAMALGCPVVAVQAAGKSYEGHTMPHYVSEGVVERVDMGDARTLAATLARLTSDADYREALIERGRKFAAQYIHPVDGALAERLFAVIAEVRRELAGTGL